MKQTRITSSTLPAVAALLLLLLGACAAPPVGDCQPGGSAAMTVLCGFRNPEDIRRLPDQRTLLVSQVSGLLQPRPGQLRFFDTLKQTVSTAFPAGAQSPDAAGEGRPPEPWGASNCPGMPGAEFSPLGISVQQRHDGRWQVAAVNHGGRMSVEMFELGTTGAGQHSLAWRGCVIAPAGVSLNSVALLRSGGFVASHMFDPSAPTLLGLNTSMLKSQLGIATGYAFEWLPTREQEFRVLAGSHGAFPNGIALSADERAVFLSLTADKQVIKLDRGSGARLAAVAVDSPDNLSWDQQGWLLAASLMGNKLQHFSCVRHPDEGCGLAFRILRIDPDALRAETVFEHEGAPMGAVTVAEQLGDSLYLGSFTGDRILKIPYRERAP
ncbi:hypothetical protein [Paucibacter soli]|uniref:hypothetical protein n=1 Tax=Paucibacter soli TaxID=3133433 RepID=UPI0030AE86DC